MTTLSTDLAGLVRELAAAPVRDHDRYVARLRLADTAFATFVGSRTGQGRLGVQVADELHGAKSLAGRAFRLVAAGRLTEIDDIDLLSCVTPGAIVVPTVLALVGGPGPIRVDVDGVLDAVVRGYEVALGLGEAIRGPQRLATGVWPSLTVGGVTAAAVAAWLLGAADDEVAAAVHLAARQSIAGNPRGNAREILLAGAVVTGICCAVAARRGFAISGGAGVVDDLLDASAEVSGSARIHRPSIKPICSARQTMGAVSALRSVLDTGEVTLDDIGRIDVHVPTEYAAMLDKPAVASRRESLSSAQYQLALAAVDPAGLYDVDRAVLRTDEAFRALMARVHVHPDADLSAQYPVRWPARVRVTVTGGTVEAVTDDVPGEHDISAETLATKLRAFGASPDLVERALSVTDVSDLHQLDISKESLA